MLHHSRNSTPSLKTLATFFAVSYISNKLNVIYLYTEEETASPVNELPGDVGKIPSERLDAIEMYFQEKLGEESYEIQALPLLSTKIEA